MPVFERAQIGQRTLPGRVHQRVLEDPADAGGIGTERGFHALRQRRLNFGEVFEHAAARPIDVGPFIEDDVNVGVAEVGEAADGLHVRRAEERRRDRIRHLVFDDVGTAIPFREDDDLRVGEIGQRIDGDVLDAPDTDRHEHADDDDDDAAVGRAPADDAINHCDTLETPKPEEGKPETRNQKPEKKPFCFLASAF